MTVTRKPRVLIVDDEPDICRNFSDILTDLGYENDWVCDGGSALDLVRRKPFDVALLDLHMPGMDGVALYREMKRIRAGIVAILVTANAGSLISDEALALGAWRVVAKPVHLPDLLDLIDRASEQPMILIVDDDLRLCDHLWQVLRQGGYRVALAHDTAEAVEQLRHASYRVAMIDMMLPDGDGRAVFALVRDADPTTRTVLMTSRSEETNSMVEKILGAGADAACFKPFDVPELLGTLDRLVNMPG